ncbi:hypothetical protein ABXS75_13290 [Roseburia hominis]
MQRRGRKLLHFFVWLSILFLFLFSGQGIYAEQQKTESEQIEQNNEVNSEGHPETNFQIPNILKIIFGTSVVAAIGSLIGIKNYFDDRKCDLDNVCIELLDEKPDNIDDYTVLECGKITKNNEIIEIGEEDYHYYDISIVIKRTPKKKIDYLAIKELIIEMNSYRIIYIPKEEKRFDYKLCSEHRGKEKYSILMIPPTARKIEHYDNLSAASIFEKPHNFKMYISYLVVANWRFFDNFIHPEPRIILFEKKIYDTNNSEIKPIGLESKSIRKGRLNNG